MLIATLLYQQMTAFDWAAVAVMLVMLQAIVVTILLSIGRAAWELITGPRDPVKRRVRIWPLGLLVSGLFTALFTAVLVLEFAGLTLTGDICPPGFHRAGGITSWSCVEDSESQ